ncbi:hypothetical protein [Corynebacterium cystitidis]|uniref:hypothetical protein n=1 Tax=Corynebacterium cystitidis TaxID=35757 RepID=UPI00211EE927|nr:hypothetical protein [Corynebacterium cystitidis]
MDTTGTWDIVLARLSSHADATGLPDFSVSMVSTIARAHLHATDITRLEKGFIEVYESGRRAI